MAYTVKAVAQKSGLSIRALHHYDGIGLLRPARVSPAGYRLYTKLDWSASSRCSSSVSWVQP